MLVVDFIKRLEEIGYDEHTELTFSCVDGNTGEWYELKPDDEDQDAFCYGEDLTGEEYHKDQIDFCLNVDDCKEYINDKVDTHMSDFSQDIREVLNRYGV